MTGVVGAGTDDRAAIFLGAHLRDRRDDDALLVFLQRRRLGRRAERDDADCARRQVLTRQALDGLDVDLVVSGEGGNQGNPYAAQVEIARHAPKGTRTRNGDS